MTLKKFWGKNGSTFKIEGSEANDGYFILIIRRKTHPFCNSFQQRVV